jgi:hypothetical protein
MIGIYRNTDIELKLDLPHRINIHRGQSSRMKIQLDTLISSNRGGLGLELR